jgi:response regulator of citrate/malate metabolism
MFGAKLRQYAAFRRTLESGDEAIDQRGVDAVFGAMRPALDDERPPKGLSAETLGVVRDTLADATQGLTAGEVAEVIGSSRVTARRYLEHLADLGESTRATRYGGTGRPHVEYRAVTP